MTTFNTIIEEETAGIGNAVLDAIRAFKESKNKTLELDTAIEPYVTTAMQRAFEAGKEERDTYWKERVRKEVERMKGIYDENGLQTQWIQKTELLQALDNLK